MTHLAQRLSGRCVAGEPEPHRHDGAELIYVIKGQLVVNVDGDDIALEAGDAMYFDSSALHAYRREGRSSCSAIVVIAPK